jgi:UPF0042 nucleotide-binding protein
MMKSDRFLIITGLSGSGKSAVSRFLEDLGYYCIDNLPAKLIPVLVDLWERKEVEIEKIGLVMDIRETGFVEEFPKALNAIRNRVACRVIFLEASDAVLIKRFSESRRPHPMAKARSIPQAIKTERERLKEIKDLADEVIDTSELNMTDLRQIMVDRFRGGQARKTQISIMSFGYKYGLPLDADFVFDSRFLPNPFYVDSLREKTGKSSAVRNYVMQFQESLEFLDILKKFLDFVIPQVVREGKSYLTVAIGCTGGKHRSVVLAEEIKQHLAGGEMGVRVHHRDAFK